MKKGEGGVQGRRLWGAHAPRVLFPAPSLETLPYLGISGGASSAFPNLRELRLADDIASRVEYSSREELFGKLPKRTRQRRVLPRRGPGVRKFETGESPLRPHRSELWFFLVPVIALAIVALAGCATTSRHQFSEPTANWQTKSGQLMYRTANMTLTGDVLVRFSKSSDFELTFSKGPGVTLLSLRQDASFAEVKGPFAKVGWSGPVEQAPSPLRGWLGLRDKLIHSRDKSVRYTVGNETFLFRF